ncbi:TonB-dependent siderophore receptor [Novosphingobium sp. MD-1]|uniref:TonB-dependent receptor plug domain-containing protein n=1 Tax=Novosphingobium sp. MD-1 TaxID=1630648 RepID=UPI00061C18C1|nr:TonB-dependent receptor [Novosphingobium sp. MD-1]GAO53658.1 outer membrane vitamin B12 receptor btuB [Novosphingobium sp. MD-1]
MRLTRCSVVSALSLSLGLPVAAHAAPYPEDPAPDAAPDTSIVVTALRTPVAQDRVSSTVTVLDEAAIRQAQPLAVTDLLVRTPGISLSRNGGYGAATSLRIRGADAGQSVMVIDGMRLSDPSATSGGYAFANLLVDDIERIEILRGPQSILWGSDAIGGVINVTTRRAEKPLEGGLAVEAGTHDTVNAQAGVGGTGTLVDWRLSASTFSTDGISARSNGTEPDGYRRTSASGTATVKLAPNLSLDLRGYWADARNDFDSTAGDSLIYGRTKEWSGYAGLNLALLDGRFTNRLAAMRTETDRENYDPARAIRPLNFDAHGRVRRFEYQGSLRLSDAVQAVFGAEREEQRMTTASPGNNTAPYALVPQAASTDSLYGELRATPLAGLTLNGGVRYDHQSRFGGNTVFSAGGVYTPNAGRTVLRASYDEGFKAPSLYQLFSLYGNADLWPEKAKGWSAGFEQALGSVLHGSATWFERDTDNLIDFAYCPTSGTLPASCYVPGTTTTRFGYYANVRKAHARGIELSGDARIGVLFAQANYSWISAQDRSPGGADFGRQLARVPRHLANIEGGIDLPQGVKASVAARYAGATFDRAGSRATLPDYWLVDLRVQWRVAGGLTVHGRIENLADRHYETASGYGSLGRTVYIGLRSRF